MYFGSDNQSGASSKVIEALVQANAGMSASYGEDLWTERAVAAVRQVFEHPECRVFFVTTGTAANCLALASLVQPWQTVICHQQAHISTDESTAPELFTAGARLVTLDAGQGRLTASTLANYLERQTLHSPHNPMPGAVSITQANEAGQVYSAEQVAEIAHLAHAKGLKLHMDGARFSNAVVSTGASPADLTWRAGVDVLCLGASKNGCLAAELVIFFDPLLAENFEFRRKRTGHLLSKGRLLGAQVEAWLDDQHWLRLAAHANAMAARLARGLSAHKEIDLIWPVDANELFVSLPKNIVERLQSHHAVFYPWDETLLPEGVQLKATHQFVRLVTSFATSEFEVDNFLSLCD